MDVAGATVQREAMPNSRIAHAPHRSAVFPAALGRPIADPDSAASVRRFLGLEGGDGILLPENGGLAQLDSGSRERLTIGLQRSAGNRATALLAARSNGAVGTAQRGRVAQRQSFAGHRGETEHVGTAQRQPAAAPGAPSQWDLAPNPYATETAGGGATPALLANPYTEENDTVTLSNARFTGEARLLSIAAGKGVLSAADNGPAMKAVQQALIDLGFEMIQHERDGRFGGETKEAIRLFRDRRGIPGDEMSARALGELDQTAPAPGVQEEHYYDYERLFADGYLDVTVAIGYDEGGTHTAALQNVHDWLSARGFEALPPEQGKPEQHRLRRDVTYPTRAGTRMTREIIIRMAVIGPGPGAAEQYGKALKDSEIAIYNGHARRGIGPDFDEDKSPKENFIIGVGSALHDAGRAIEPSKIEQHHYVIDRVNDLEQMTKSGEFDKEKYRIWFFGACTSMAYFDEIRGGILPGNVDRTNLDLLGTRQPLYKVAGVPSILAMVEGILASQTIEQITTAMEKAGEDAIRAAGNSEAVIRAARHTIIHEGAGDNPVAAPASP
jgi:peptidoglycan hydrolase-like protein with peptidoglycan-binding domain